MQRGEVWVAADARASFASKPRPVLVVEQVDLTDEGDRQAVTICPVTSERPEDEVIRVPIQATQESGLNARSWVEVDLVSTVRVARLGHRIGQAPPEVMTAVGRNLAVHLGIV